MALLEMSRLAGELDSDLGLITPMVVRMPQKLRVGFTMAFADARNPDFLERLGAFDGPRNMADLRPDSDLVVPDLLHRSFRVPAGWLAPGLPHAMARDASG